MSDKDLEMIYEAYREDAYKRGGFRERYAVNNGTPRLAMFGCHRVIVYEYGKDDPYQDGNGAMYDVAMERWIG